MRGSTRKHCVGRLQPFARERGISADLTRKTRQRVGAADIGKEADAHLGHRESISVARYAMRAVDRDADATAHHDAIDQRNIRLAIALDLGVEYIFLAEE